VLGAYSNVSQWKPVTLPFFSQQISHVLAWEPLGAMTKDDVTCGTGGSQWGDTSSDISQPRTKRASGTMEYLILNSYIFLNSLLLFIRMHVNGRFSLIWAQEHITYFQLTYYILMPISVFTSLLIKLHKEEQNWMNYSVSF
jgi:hypothetical protein